MTQGLGEHDSREFPVAMRRTLIGDMFGMGLKPADMLEHVRREVDGNATPFTVHNDLKWLRVTGVISGRAGNPS